MMASTYSLLLLSLVLGANSQSSGPVDINGNPQPVPQFPASAGPVPLRGPITGDNQGWPYFCANSGAPPVCNSECEVAINELCKSNKLDIGLTAIEGNCEVSYFPRKKTPNTQPGIYYTEQNCIERFQGILDRFGKNASDSRTQYDPKYCTSSGGGGTWGWNDDGSVMEGEARFTITPKGSNQCGQHTHPKALADQIIEWKPEWITDADQVVYDTSVPPLTEFPEPPKPNPLCDIVTCNIKDEPYYASKGRPDGVESLLQNPHDNGKNWQEKSGYLRHQVWWAGWANTADGLQFLKALTARCPSESAPYNFQAWTDGDSHVSEFELFHTATEDHCWCIADAIYDASGGIKLLRSTWCEDNQFTGQPTPEFAPVGDDAIADPVNLGECQNPYDPERKRPGPAPAQCGATNPAQAPATNPPANGAQQAPAANSDDRDLKIKRTPEQHQLRKRYLEEEIGPLFHVVGRSKPDAAPKAPRKARRSGMWW